MAGAPLYKTSYEKSWAFVIGINDYAHAPPLLYAKNDADGVVKILETKFGFPAANIVTLFDAAANAAAIRKAFLDFSDDKRIGPDDRLVVFFAGHGYTTPGRRGDVGFLVPSDGNATDKSTLIRWDELTRNAEFILAKHIFFVMDACYGGLALQRQPSFGSMRFLGDMLQRYARQVLTAGKPDEPVSDGNGVRPGHSLFTAHFLNALDGAASTQDGIITASGVMAYVFEKVGTDQYSKQTPHYGFIDGDGDFIFHPPGLTSPRSGGVGGGGSRSGDDDILINTSPEVEVAPEAEKSVSDAVKDLLSDPSLRIKLDDFVSRQVRSFLAATDLRHFPIQGGPVSPGGFIERVTQYEHTTKNIQHIVILLAKWGEGMQLQLLERVFTRLAEADKGSSGLVMWVHLTWYPLLLLIYSTGISALAARNYDALRIVLMTKVQPDPESGRPPMPLVVSIIHHITQLHDHFKTLPGYEQKYVPRSEHLFKAVQPALEDELLLGRSYEGLFDEFEVLMALSYSDVSSSGWGPPGRFAWKHARDDGAGPFDQLVADAKAHGQLWPPIAAGLFSGSFERFLEVASKYRGQLDKLGWY